MNWILCLFVLLLSSCDQKPQETQYNEIIVQAEGSNEPESSSMGDIFTWVTPQGWNEADGEGMRLATFHLRSDPGAIDCSILSLGATAGSLEANLRRWMRQLAIQTSDDHVNSLITSALTLKTKDGLEAKIFDFTNLQTFNSPSDKSMLATIIVLDKATVFIKMTGSIQAVKQNKEDYLELVASIARK